jgi:hypothetical protein
MEMRKMKPNLNSIEGRTKVMRKVIKAKTFAYPYWVSHVLDEYKNPIAPISAIRGDIA